MFRGSVKILLLIFTAVLLQACGSQDICDEDNESLLVARFRTLADGNIVDTTLNVISIRGTRNGSDGLPFYSEVQAGRVILPLNPSFEESCFIFSDMDLTDTLCIEYNMEAYLISEKCGFAGRYTLRKVRWTGTMINNVEIIDESVDAEYVIDEEHLWIYF